MEKIVIKTGVAMFDALHALGLAIFLSEAYRAEVHITNTGLVYSLNLDSVSHSPSFIETFKKLFIMPSREMMTLYATDIKSNSTENQNFDGLLALLISSPGLRVVSMFDLSIRVGKHPEALDAAIEKATRSINLWKRLAIKRLRKITRDLDVDHLLDQYHPKHTVIPEIKELRRGTEISLLLTLDPSLGLSSYRSISDGVLGCDENLTVTGNTLAPLFAIIGATRFLRAQRVNGSLVNCYVPLPAKVTLSQGFSSPVLTRSEFNYDTSVLLEWIRSYKSQRDGVSKYQGIAYQTLYSSSHAIFPKENGILLFDKLNRLAERSNDSLCDSWEHILKEQDEVNDCLGGYYLTDFLFRNDWEAWEQHVYRFCSAWNKPKPKGQMGNIQCYSIDEVQEVFGMMETNNMNLLSHKLGETAGITNFGRAFRQLGRYNHFLLVDLLHELEDVYELEQLLVVLGKAMQQIVLAEAKDDFIFVPNQKDFQLLMADVEDFGARKVALVLYAISTLRNRPFEASNSIQTSQEEMHDDQ